MTSHSRSSMTIPSELAIRTAILGFHRLGSIRKPSSSNSLDNGDTFGYLATELQADQLMIFSCFSVRSASPAVLINLWGEGTIVPRLPASLFRINAATLNFSCALTPSPIRTKSSPGLADNIQSSKLSEWNIRCSALLRAQYHVCGLN